MRRDRTEYHRQYRLKNIVRLTRYKESRRAIEAEKARQKRKTPYGLLYCQYMHQIEQDKKRPKYSLIDYFNFAFTSPNFRELFFKWRDSGFKKGLVPSCDRIDATKPYSLGNIQFMTWDENYEKRDMDLIHVMAKKRGYRVKLVKI